MARYIAARLAWTAVTIIGVVTAAFFLLRALPGDPAVAILGDFATVESLRQVRENLGLNDPVVVQYGRFVANAATGDLGLSAISRQPAMHQVLSVLPASFVLAVSGVLIALLIGMPAGVVAAVRRGTWFDYLTMGTTVSGISFPSFWLGLVAILVFAGYLGWFPATGIGRAGDIGSQLRALALPAIVLSFAVAAYIARLTRSAMLEVLGEDYIRVAQAMGIRRRRVLYRYALKNALPPILSIIGVSFAWALGNAILVEVVFSRPGLGSVIIKATLTRDYQVVQAGVLVLGTMVVAVNAILDILYAIVDPRIRRA